MTLIPTRSNSIFNDFIPITYALRASGYLVLMYSAVTYAEPKI